MLRPPVHLRPRAQSNPAHPKGSSRANDGVDKPGSTSISPPMPLGGGAREDKDKDKDKDVMRKWRLHRPRSRRASVVLSTTPATSVPSPHPVSPPDVSTSTSASTPASTSTAASLHPNAQPPARPPRNPARLAVSSYSRPLSSSGARDYQALRHRSPSPSTSNLPNTGSGSASGTLHKFVKRHKSISANVSGYVLGWREERREREKGKGKKSTRPATATSPLSHTLNLPHEPELQSPHSSPSPPLTPNSPTLLSPPSPMLSSSSSSSSSALSGPPQALAPALQVSNASSSAPHLARTFSLHSSRSIPISTSTKRSTTVKIPKPYKPQPKSKPYPLPPSQSQPKDQGKGKAKGDPSAHFSTLDRTILAELKHSLMARESQFVLKGPSYLGSSLGSGLGSKLEGGGQNSAGVGVRHHPFRREEVPYPRSYERGIIDLDVWETLWYQQLCGSVTFHAFETPPTKVLDLGCGTGTWVFECARRWKDCHFVGLDVVPLQPDLQHIGASNLKPRITWVQANFLEGLPFPNEEFDFVHVKRIARGVPEDKWASLFEEIIRVMKPGGAFEMFEEELYFPGKSHDADEVQVEVENVADLDSLGSVLPALSDGSPKSVSQSVPLASDSSARPNSPPTPKVTVRRNQEPEPVLSVERKVNVAPPPAPASPRREPSPKSLFRPPPLSRPKTAPATSKARTRLPTLSISTTVSAPVGEGKTNTSADSHHQPSVFTMKASDFISYSTHRHQRHQQRATSPTASISVSSSFSPTTPIPVLNSNSNSSLVRTAPMAPVNPRDHTVLEMIYTEMHAARFINLAPLSLLASDLSTWFKDVRTHSPLIFTFPPPAAHPRPRLTQPHSRTFHHIGIDDDSGFSDSETSPVRADDHLSPYRVEDFPQVQRVMPISLADETTDSRFVSVQSLVSGTAPYTYLDDARFTGFSPSGKASFPSVSAASQASPQAAHDTLSVSVPQVTQNGLQKCEAPDPHSATEPSASSGELPPQPSLSAPSSQPASRSPEPAAKRPILKNRLPNTTLQVDLRTLNLHLALRTYEVLACAEAMWEWVLEFQEEEAKRKHIVGRVRSTSEINGSPPKIRDSQIADPIKSAIAELSRSEFDALLIQFNLDMRDQFALGSLLEERFAWSMIPMPATQDRILFDTARDKWDEYRRQQRLEQNAHFRHPSQGPRHSQLFPEVISHLPATMAIRNATINFEEDAHLSAPQGALAHSNSRSSGRVAGLPNRAPRSTRSQSRTSLTKEAGLLEATNDVHPSQFLCRTMRVFVAWKA